MKRLHIRTQFWLRRRARLGHGKKRHRKSYQHKWACFYSLKNRKFSVAYTRDVARFAIASALSRKT